MYTIFSHSRKEVLAHHSSQQQAPSPKKGPLHLKIFAGFVTVKLK